MKPIARKLFLLFLALFSWVLLHAGLFSCAIVYAGDDLKRSGVEDRTVAESEERERILHVLNRVTFGPTSALVERVSEMGIDAYLREQLKYETIADPLVNKKLQLLDTLELDSQTLIRAYYDRIKTFLTASQQLSGSMTEEARIRLDLDGLMQNSNSESQGKAHPISFAEQIEFLMDRVDLRAIGELQHAKIIRAVHSERQLYEVMVDFWSNHFNIDVSKATAGPLKIVDDREVIRAHAMGNFRDLLGASAQSPAMLIYLDNDRNAVRRKLGWFEKRIRNYATGYLVGVDASSINANGDAEGMIGGLNENYGRELLELHTLGVDGGYTQQDVVEVSRAFTGWGYNPFSGSFSFNGRNHDAGSKRVLGSPLGSSGIDEGEEVLDRIALHPSTANHLAFKLCQRFVSDNPPEELVGEVAAAFLASDGDIKTTLKAVLFSDAFFAEENRKSKLKSPFEFAVSSLRLMNADVVVEPSEARRHMLMTFEGLGTTGNPPKQLAQAKRKTVNWRLVEMGQPLFAYPAPTGYPEDSSHWQEAGLALQRMNFALALVRGEIAGIRTNASMNEMETIVSIDRERLSEERDEALRMAALLASPEFQYR